MNPLTRHRVFGKDKKPTIYYFVGYRGKISRFESHIKLFVRAGFRVMAFEYDPKVLGGGKPQFLITAIKEVLKVINDDKQNREIAGAYGISLGSLFVLNVAWLPEIKKAILNTGGVRLSKAVWESPLLQQEKAAYKENGYTRAQVDKAWDPYDISTDGNKLMGKKLLVMDSKDDPIILFEDVDKHFKAWQAQGVDVTVLLTRRLNHGQAILRNILRLKTTIQFFKS